MDDTRLAHSVEETAKLLGKHPNTIYRAIRDGELKAVRLRDSWLVSQKEIDRLLDGKK